MTFSVMRTSGRSVRSRHRRSLRPSCPGGYHATVAAQFRETSPPPTPPCPSATPARQKEYRAAQLKILVRIGDSSTVVSAICIDFGLSPHHPGGVIPCHHSARVTMDHEVRVRGNCTWKNAPEFNRQDLVIHTGSIALLNLKQSAVNTCTYHL